MLVNYIFDVLTLRKHVINALLQNNEFKYMAVIINFYPMH